MFRWIPKGLSVILSVMLLAITMGSVADAEPQRGGTLIVGRSGDSTTLDPNDSEDLESTLVSAVFAEPLVRFKPGTLEIEPWLATSWDVSQDGLTWRFHLREGVRFHDGTLFDADAVVFTFERILNPDNPYHHYGNWVHAQAQYGEIAHVEAIDQYTVEFQLKNFFGPMLTALASPRGGIVSPTAVRADPENFFRRPVGTGAFRLVEWRPDDRVVIERFDDYWGDTAYLDRVIFRVIPETVTRVLALAQGEIHVMTGVDQAALRIVETNPALKLYSAPGLLHSYLTPNHTKDPWTDVRVRQALFHAINREALVQAFWPGGSVARGVMSPLMLGFNDDLEWYEYNPEKARQLLAEAGYPDGFKTTLRTFNVARAHTPEPRKAAEAIQANLAQVGIDVQIILDEVATFLDRARAAEHDLMMTGFNPILPDPWTVMYSQFDSRRAVLGQANNFSFYRNPEVDRLNDLANRAADPEERAGYYRELQEIVHRDAVRVDIADVNTLLGMRQEVQDLIPDAQLSLYLQYAWLKR